LKKLDEGTSKQFEKSGGNSQARTSNGGQGSRLIYQKCDINPLKPAPPAKKQHISVKKPAKAQQQPTPENIRIQLTSSNPNEDGEGQEKSGKSSKTGGKGEKNPYKVTLVYRPIVDIDIEKRYAGFKANSNKNDAGNLLQPSIPNLSLSLVILALFSLIL
jgi:hypothetical protein